MRIDFALIGRVLRRRGRGGGSLVVWMRLRGHGDVSASVITRALCSEVVPVLVHDVPGIYDARHMSEKRQSDTGAIMPRSFHCVMLLLCTPWNTSKNNKCRIFLTSVEKTGYFSVVRTPGISPAADFMNMLAV